MATLMPLLLATPHAILGVLCAGPTASIGAE